ncbi:MAG: amino acid ABC transporter permease [Enterococcus cecorum]|nr:amino acid ABC transporter permease [Enterococcus cecorum]
MISLHIDKIPSLLGQIIPFIPVTLFVVFISSVLGSLLGGAIARLLFSQKKLSRRFAQTYIYLLRCTPPIVLLFIVYYGLPKLFLNLFEIDLNVLDKLIFVVISFTLLFAASAAETFRSAYLAIDAGQTEAGLASGLTALQTFWRIIFPQALRVALPNYCNSLVNLMKEGTLAYTIGLVDLMGQANLILGRNYGNYAIETYLSVAIVYWLFVLIIELSFNMLERHLAFERLPKKAKEGVHGYPVLD